MGQNYPKKKIHRTFFEALTDPRRESRGATFDWPGRLRLKQLNLEDCKADLVSMGRKIRKQKKFKYSQ